jgi:hypothetical protein
MILMSSLPPTAFPSVTKRISKPIIALAEIAHAIADHQDFLSGR